MGRIKTVDPDVAPYLRVKRKGGVKIRPNLTPRPGSIVGYHKSSNLESMAKGLKPRQLGFSVGPTAADILSSPTRGEPQGTRGVALVKIKGKGLDASRLDDRMGLQKLWSDSEKAYRAGKAKGGIDTEMLRRLRASGVDFVKNWSGFTPTEATLPEHHIVNQPKAEILRAVKLKDQRYGDIREGRGIGTRLAGKVAGRFLGSLGPLGYISQYQEFREGMERMKKKDKTVLNIPGVGGEI